MSAWILEVNPQCRIVLRNTTLLLHPMKTVGLGLDEFEQSEIMTVIREETAPLGSAITPRADPDINRRDPGRLVVWLPSDALRPGCPFVVPDSGAPRGTVRVRRACRHSNRRASRPSDYRSERTVALSGGGICGSYFRNSVQGCPLFVSWMLFVLVQNSMLEKWGMRFREN